MYRAKIKMTWTRRLLLTFAFLFILFMHVALPILNYPADHIIEWSDQYRGISSIALAFTAAWFCLWWRFSYLTWTEFYSRDISYY